MISNKTPIGFMSYVRSDDEHEKGRMTEFRARLCGEVQFQSGDKSFDIFLDHLHIVWGQQWQQRLGESLGAVCLLIPMITPSFFKSEHCRAEVLRFVEREKQLGRSDLILPVYYVKTPLLEDPNKRMSDPLAELIYSRNHIDWRPLRHHALDSQAAKEKLAEMAEQIVAALERENVPVAPTKPAWASASGVDSYGKWAEINVQGVVQRLRWIAPGSFVMGSPEAETAGLENADWFIDEHPQHRVTISQGLWLADTACTQEMWQVVMGENPSRFHAKNKGGPQHPVERVSWDMIQPFLQKMDKALPGSMMSLPTEAEWEYACRAESSTAFAFGDTVSTDQVNFNGNYLYGKGKKGEYRERTMPVKALPANAWGLYQMHGNVWEWCADGPREYKGSALADPGLGEALQPEAGGGAARVLRGGGWIFDARFVRSAYRIHLRPDGQDDDAGFRLALRFPSAAGK